MLTDALLDVLLLPYGLVILLEKTSVGSDQRLNLVEIQKLQLICIILSMKLLSAPVILLDNVS